MKNKEKKTNKTFAEVVWTKYDVKTLQPKWSLKKCEEFLEENERTIRDATIEHGWEVMHQLMR